MHTLHEAREARSGKINKIEKLKTLKAPREVYERLDTICAGGYDNLADEDSAFFLKCFGIFDKKDGTFMMRLRVPGGQLSAVQAETIGAVARDFGRDYIDITTRQQIELRYLPFAALPEVMRRLDATRITTFQTGVDNFRNIVTSPFDGVAADRLIECLPIIEAMQAIFLARDEWIGVLPRKFNTAILGTRTNDCNIFGHDCCFLPAERDGIIGFNLYLGGKVGVQARDSGLFVPPEAVVPVFRALIEVFKTYGFRDNRNKNRLHFLIEAVGLPYFAEVIKTFSGLDLSPSGRLLLENEHRIDAEGGVDLAGGLRAVLFPIPSGVFSGSDLCAAADCARNIEGMIRLSVEQSFYLICEASRTPQVTAHPLYAKYRDYHDVYFTHQVACAGEATCQFGVIPNKPDAIAMAEYLQREVPMAQGKIRMYWSACPKGCGLHGIGDIGFEGCKAKDAEGNGCYGVHVYLGGKAAFGAQEARILYKALPLPEAQRLVGGLAMLYRDERIGDESFEAYDSRVLSALDPETIRERVAAKLATA